MKALIFLLCLTANSALAANLENVDLLSVEHRKNSIELKLHAKSGPKDSYFFVNIANSDSNSFEKLAFVIKKLEKGDKFKLDLEIPSFSISPSGSYYRSESVKFSGND